MAEVTAIDRTKLSGTGAAEPHAKELLDKVDALITGLGVFADRVGVDVDGNITLYFNEAKTAYVTWNSVDGQFEYYINDTLQGVWDLIGPSAEPGA